MDTPYCASGELFVSSTFHPTVCHYPEDSIGPNSFWCCRNCALNTLDGGFQLNLPEDHECRKCGRPRHDIPGLNNNSIEHLICRWSGCRYINPVYAETCGREGCSRILPNHPSRPRILRNNTQPRLFFVSKRRESKWLCTMCLCVQEDYNATCGTRAKRNVPRCTGRRGKAGVWIVRPGMDIGGSAL